MAKAREPGFDEERFPEYRLTFKDPSWPCHEQKDPLRRLLEVAVGLHSLKDREGRLQRHFLSLYGSGQRKNQPRYHSFRLLLYALPLGK